jgi:hypothetical protein
MQQTHISDDSLRYAVHNVIKLICSHNSHIWFIVLAQGIKQTTHNQDLKYYCYFNMYDTEKRQNTTTFYQPLTIFYSSVMSSGSHVYCITYIKMVYCALIHTSTSYRCVKRNKRPLLHKNEG